MRALAHALIAIAVGIVGIESSLTVLSWVFPAAAAVLAPPWSRSPGFDFSFEDSLLGRHPSPSHPGHDSRGFRNAEAVDRAEIVALGDSQTYGYGVARHEAWPQQLGTLSGRSTYNISFGGYGPTHSLALMDLALSLQPEVVIEAFYSGNDLWDAYHMVHERGQLAELESDDPEVAQAIDAANRENSLTARVEALTRVYATGRFDEPGGQGEESAGPSAGDTGTESTSRRAIVGVRRFLTEHSSLYGLARALWYTLPDRELDEPEEWSRLMTVAAATGGLWEAVEGSGFRTIAVPRYRNAALDREDARILEGYRLSISAIRRMEQRTKASGARFLVVLVPTKLLVFAWLTDATGRSDDYSALIEQEVEMWADTKETLDRYGIEYLDALPAIRDTFTHGQQPYPLSQNGHPNATGQRAIAELIADWLARS